MYLIFCLLWWARAVCLACCLVQYLAQSGCSVFQKYILNNEQIKWSVPTSPYTLSLLYFYPSTYHIWYIMFIYTLGNCLSYPQNVSSMKMNCSLHYEMNCFVHCVSTGPRKVNNILLNRFFFFEWLVCCMPHLEHR